MHEVVSVYKKRGETPKECIERFRVNNPQYKTTSLAYAGRLDPAAEGVLLILVGDACKDQETYHALEKTYRISIVLGVTTDTYDLLGLVTGIDKHVSVPMKTDIESLRARFTGTIQQSYPPYSSKPIDGKPLFMWAREGRLNEISIPTHEVTISNIELLGIASLSSSQLVRNAIAETQYVSGDFRQERIIQTWQEVSTELPETLPVLELRVSCSSGTYMRQLAYDIGKVLGAYGLASHIVRERVGKYRLEDTNNPL